MKSFLDKFSSYTSRYEFLFLVFPFILWVICFRHFFNGNIHLEADATSYADNIGIYTDNLCKGVFPLWSSGWFNGSPYHFFLRRIGDMNPLLFLIVYLKWFGVSSEVSYRIFLGMYYFLGGWAFYLITRHLLKDRFFAFTAFILFLFSSWGCEIFYNYIIIIFVPGIWFFYFLLSFFRTPRKGYLLGMCLCVGVLLTTYIPFFFLTVLFIFFFLYLLFYGKDFLDFIKRSGAFFQKNAFFTIFCVFFLIVSCIPGLIFYKESKSGETVMPARHSGSDASSVVTVGIESVTSGDIISHGYFDRVFDDHANLDLGDIYLPFVFFLILMASTFARVNKLIFFLLFNILALSLITITSAAGVHRFLYEHLIIFKFIRNIYYFFWLAMQPMTILLSVSAFKSLLEAVHESTKKINWLIYIITCHLIFIIFLCMHQGVLWGGWFGVAISLIYFLVYFGCERKVSYFAGYCLFLLAMFVQSAQVYGALSKKVYHEQQDAAVYIKEVVNVKTYNAKLDLYYASSWFAVLDNYIDQKIFDDYRYHHFIFYDNVVPYKDEPGFFKTLQTAMAQNTNVAFIPLSESGSDDWRSSAQAMPKADINPVVSGKLSILMIDANTLTLKAHLPSRKFLVVNDNYNKDWHAFINGREVHIFRTNVSYKGLWVPSGESTVILRFSSPLRYAFHISLLILFAGTFLYLLILLRKRTPSGGYV